MSCDNKDFEANDIPLWEGVTWLLPEQKPNLSLICPGPFIATLAFSLFVTCLP